MRQPPRCARPVTPYWNGCTRSVAPHLAQGQENQGRRAQANEWQAVNSTHTLAIRLNERLVQGSIHDQQELSILHKGNTVPVQLTLYVIRPMSGPGGAAAPP